MAGFFSELLSSGENQIRHCTSKRESELVVSPVVNPSPHPGESSVISKIVELDLVTLIREEALQECACRTTNRAMV